MLSCIENAIFEAEGLGDGTRIGALVLTVTAKVHEGGCEVHTVPEISPALEERVKKLVMRQKPTPGTYTLVFTGPGGDDAVEKAVGPNPTFARFLFRELLEPVNQAIITFVEQVAELPTADQALHDLEQGIDQLIRVGIQMGVSDLDIRLDGISTCEGCGIRGPTMSMGTVRHPMIAAKGSPCAERLIYAATLALFPTAKKNVAARYVAAAAALQKIVEA